MLPQPYPLPLFLIHLSQTSNNILKLKMILSGRGGGNGGGGCKFPFTASQWQELEHQALIFKYMVSGVPIPPELLFSVKRSFLDSSSTSPHLGSMGWGCFQMGLGLGMRKIDPEPGRCRRTDGKKWRCSKEAFQESKYCEKHMHRGKNRSRKHVELQQQMQHVSTTPASIVKSTKHYSSSLSSSVTSDHYNNNSNSNYQLYPHSYYSSIHPYHHQSTQLGLHSGAGVDDYDDENGRRTRREKTVYRFLEECPPDNNNNKDSSAFMFMVESG